jgi:hypothetical protein
MVEEASEQLTIIRAKFCNSPILLTLAIAKFVTSVYNAVVLGSTQISSIQNFIFSDLHQRMA